MSAPSTHSCPADGCAELIPHERLACLAHWNQLPVDLRTAVIKTYARRLRSRGTSYYRGPRREHMEAVAAATAWIRGAL
jgi:hypothetical protein